MDNKALILKVTDNDENFEDSADTAVVVIDKKLKLLILNARKELKRLKKNLSRDMFDIRLFNYSPVLFGSGEMMGKDEETGKEVDQKGLKIVSPEFAEECD